MPLMVEGVGAIPASPPMVGFPEPGLGRAAGRLDIGLVNNMPDAALDTTERQFARVLASASGTVDVRLHLFSLAGVPRGPAARATIAGRYGDLAALERARLDGLIVTGAEPVAPSLDQEPYWEELTRVVDWAEHNTASTIWSCLAAHAAVLHLDGIARRRLPEKCFGLFACANVADAGLLDGTPANLCVPHSRWNDLAESDLRSCGYRIESRSGEAGVDRFAKQWRSLFVFLQGHPEYDADTLFREYRRDVQRYFKGERDDLPSVPCNYFDRRTERGIAAFEDAARHRPEVESWASFPKDWACRPALLTAWKTSAARLYRQWLDTVALSRSGM